MFDQITSFENLHQAYRLVRRLKRFRVAQQRYELHLEVNLARLQDRLRSQKYRPRAYRHFMVHEPKMRQIAAPHFEDRIVHQAIVRIIEPQIVSTFIPSSYACIKGRGTHKAVLDLQQALGSHSPDSFFLKADIRHYFASIDHQALKQIIRRHISCPKTLSLLDQIVASFEADPGKGIPIGNLTSQIFANMYLSDLDRFARDSGMTSYFRYMDDFVVVADQKQQVLRFMRDAERFLHEELVLDLHPQKRLVQRTSFGIDFCGYHILADRILMRKKTLRRFVRKYKRAHKKLEALKRQQQALLFPELEPQVSDRIQELEAKLAHSVTSHSGFLRYAQLDFSKGQFAYASNIRLPYQPQL